MLPSAAFAAEDFMSISQTLLPEFDQEMANARKLLELVPENQLAFKPHEKSMALGRLASHIAEMPSWGAHTLQMELLELESGQQPFNAQSREELIAAFDKGVAEARALLESTTDEDWAKIWTMKFGGQVVISQPRAHVYRGVVMNHLIHHRAQLGVYLRLNEVEIPGMYGPSADEMKYWTAPAA
jgi:uncharacterized damage-inducible protein DinB